jgi:hypothetical protein
LDLVKGDREARHRPIDIAEERIALGLGGFLGKEIFWWLGLETSVGSLPLGVQRRVDLVKH